MLRFFFSLLWSTLLLSPSLAQQKTRTATKAGANRPNIILIMVDDMGYSDLGCYGSEISTPNLDRLATEGIRLREFYNNSICAPTRASLLTGQYPHKAGVGYFDVNLGIPPLSGLPEPGVAHAGRSIPVGRLQHHAVGQMARG